MDRRPALQHQQRAARPGILWPADAEPRTWSLNRLSHPGDYNFGDDNDGDGIPDPITYEGDAFYYQDNQQYTIMSYFDMYEAGNNQVDWNFMRFVYPSTPMVHDIWVAQQIYGAETSTPDG